MMANMLKYQVCKQSQEISHFLRDLDRARYGILESEDCFKITTASTMKRTSWVCSPVKLHCAIFNLFTQNHGYYIL